MAEFINNAWKHGAFPLGWRRDKPGANDSMLRSTLDVIPEIDLRKTGFLPPVYQQYDTNACTAMCLGAAIEYLTKKEGKPVFKPSKCFMYWNARVLGDCTDKDDGAELRDAIMSLIKWGSAPDADYPFLPQHIDNPPPQKAYEDAEKEIISEFQRIPSTAEDIAGALARGTPIIFGAEVFANFNTEETAKTGIIPMPKGKHKGGHCMLIVGIKPGFVIVRNSWGVDWGEHGYGYVPLEYVENDNLVGDFWVVNVV